mmetsp:Transcript_14122/g.15738  ORF Transcript_14122/g.15738 Transcript_14122/m.15738 type:complete len:175 (+) Transcript_14122:68-592(+)
MKRSIENELETDQPATRRVRFSADTDQIGAFVPSSSSPSFDNTRWYSKADLAVVRLTAMEVSAQVQKQIPSKDINPFHTRYCDQCLKGNHEGETVRGLERLINPHLGIQRKQEREGVIKGVLFAQAIARYQKCLNGNVNIEQLIASFVKNETGNAKLVAQLVEKADQETAAIVH